MACGSESDLCVIWSQAVGQEWNSDILHIKAIIQKVDFFDHSKQKQKQTFH